jgi:hypothetical protein
MQPHLRHAVLTAHIMSSLGWFGAVVAFLALTIAELANGNQQVVRAAYVAMELTGWFVIVPFCFASLATGLIQSLGTSWGLIRHRWIVAKLVIALMATILLVLHMRPVSYVANIVSTTTLSHNDLRAVRLQLFADAVLAVVALTLTTALSVCKPAGLTPYGRRVYADRVTAEDEAFPWSRVWAVGAGLLVMLFALVDLAGLGLHSHGHVH